MRSKYWDGWKGLCIIEVVAGHAIFSNLAFPLGSSGWYAETLSIQLFNFPVAVFLAIAGFFSLGRSGGAQIENAGSYYRRRFMRIIPPYLIWTAVYLLLQLREHPLSLHDVSREVLLGTGMGIGFFIIVLVQFILLTPLLSRLNDRRTHLILMAALFLCGVLFTYGVRMGMPGSRWAHFPYDSLPFFAWYPSYHLGLFAAKFNLAEDPRLRRLSAWLIPSYLVFAAVAMAEGIYLASLDNPLGISQLKASSLIISTIVFLLALSGRPRALAHLFNNNFLGFLGRESYAIYLTHLIFLPRVARLINISMHLPISRVLGVALIMLVTLLLSAILAGLLRKVSQKYQELVAA